MKLSYESSRFSSLLAACGRFPNFLYRKTALLQFSVIAWSVACAIAYVQAHFDALTRVAIRVSSAFIFQTFSEVRYLSF